MYASYTRACEGYRGYDILDLELRGGQTWVLGTEHASST